MGIRRFFMPFESAREEMEEYINSLPEDQRPVARRALELFFPVSEAEKGVIGGIYITAGNDKINVNVSQLKKLVSTYVELTNDQQIIFVKAVPLFLSRLKTVSFDYHLEEGLPIEYRFQIAKLYAELSVETTEAIKLTVLGNYLAEVARDQPNEVVNSTFIDPVTGASTSRSSRRGSYINYSGISALRSLSDEDFNTALIEFNKNEIMSNFLAARCVLSEEQRKQVDQWVTCLSYQGGFLTAPQLRAARVLLSPTA